MGDTDDDDHAEAPVPLFGEREVVDLVAQVYFDETSFLDAFGTGWRRPEAWFAVGAYFDPPAKVSHSTLGAEEGCVVAEPGDWENAPVSVEAPDGVRAVLDGTYTLTFEPEPWDDAVEYWWVPRSFDAENRQLASRDDVPIRLMSPFEAEVRTPAMLDVAPDVLAGIRDGGPFDLTWVAVTGSARVELLVALRSGSEVHCLLDDDGVARLDGDALGFGPNVEALWVQRTHLTAVETDRGTALLRASRGRQVAFH